MRKLKLDVDMERKKKNFVTSHGAGCTVVLLHNWYQTCKWCTVLLFGGRCTTQTIFFVFSMCIGVCLGMHVLGYIVCVCDHDDMAILCPKLVCQNRCS